MEQSRTLSIITGLFPSFKPTYNRLVHHTLFLNAEVTFFSAVVSDLEEQVNLQRMIHG